MDTFDDHLYKDIRGRTKQKDKSLVWLGDRVDERMVHRNFKDRGEAFCDAVRCQVG